MSNLSDLLNGITEEAEATAETAVERKSTQTERFVFFQQNTGQAETDYEVPVAPATKNLRGFQANAVELALNAKRLILGWAPGMGKTLPAMAVTAAEAAEGRKTIFVTPPSLITQLSRAFSTDFPSVKFGVLRGKKNVTLDGVALDPEVDEDGNITHYEIPSDLDCIIVGDSVLMARSDDLKAWGAANVIFDEAQHFQDDSSQRSRALHDICNTIDDDGIVMGLTGTLVKGSALGVYSPVSALGDYVATKLSGAATLAAFKRAWLTVDGFGGCAITTEMARNLHSRLTQTCYDFHRPEDVLDLPAYNVVTVGSDLNGELDEYKRAEQNFLAWVEEQKGLPAAERAAKALAIVRMNALREEAGKAKRKVAAERVAELVEAGEKVVVMAEHISVVEGLAEILRDTDVDVATGGSRKINVSMFYGKLNESAKTENMDSFKDGDADVIVVNIKAGGVGLNLPEATNLIFVQTPWVPGQFAQCARRIVRADSKEIHGDDDLSCTIQVINGIDTIDERLWARLDAKAAITDILNSGEQDITLDGASVFDEVLEDYGWFD